MVSGVSQCAALSRRLGRGWPAYTERVVPSKLKVVAAPVVATVNATPPCAW
jgi:hypothetical protein